MRKERKGLGILPWNQEASQAPRLHWGFHTKEQQCHLERLKQLCYWADQDLDTMLHLLPNLCGLLGFAHLETTLELNPISKSTYNDQFKRNLPDLSCFIRGRFSREDRMTVRVEGGKMLHWTLPHPCAADVQTSQNYIVAPFKKVTQNLKAFSNLESNRIWLTLLSHTDRYIR